MQTEKHTDWILTRSGKKAYPLEMDPEMVCLEDVAHALSMICRWSGHCSQHYSVCQHVLLVAELVAIRHRSPTLTLLALHHDSHEAYLGDTARPVKRYCRASFGMSMAPWGQVEEQCQDAINQALFPHLMWNEGNYALVKEADDAFLYYEWQMLMPESAHGEAFEVHSAHAMSDHERTHITQMLARVTNPYRTFIHMHNNLLAQIAKEHQNAIPKH